MIQVWVRDKVSHVLRFIWRESRKTAGPDRLTTPWTTWWATSSLRDSLRRRGNSTSCMSEESDSSRVWVPSAVTIRLGEFFLSVPAARPLQADFWVTHLTPAASSAGVSAFSTRCSDSSEQILRQAVWCSKQKGLKAFPAATQTPDFLPFKGEKHNLAQEKKNYSHRTQTQAHFSLWMQQNSLKIILSGWSLCLSGSRHLGRLIMVHNLCFALCTLWFINFCFVPGKVSPGALRMLFHSGLFTAQC